MGGCPSWKSLPPSWVLALGDGGLLMFRERVLYPGRQDFQRMLALVEQVVATYP